jgi:hypothetical protein
VVAPRSSPLRCSQERLFDVAGTAPTGAQVTLPPRSAAVVYA